LALVGVGDVQADGHMPDVDEDLSRVRGATKLMLRVEAVDDSSQRLGGVG
jgi:hypothetical protein